MPWPKMTEERRKQQSERMKLRWAKFREEKANGKVVAGLTREREAGVNGLNEMPPRPDSEGGRLPATTAPEGDVEARFHAVYDKALRKLEGMIGQKLDLEELNMVIKTCRENLAAINQAKVRDTNSEMVVETVLDFDEKGKVQ